MINSDQTDEYKHNDIDCAVPTYSPKVLGYNVVVMPIAPRKKTSGGIIIPETARDGEKFLNCLGRIVKRGTGAFQIPQWQNLKVGEEDIPAIGEIVRWEGTHSREFYYKDVLMLCIRDEQIKDVAVPEEEVREQCFRFWR